MIHCVLHIGIGKTGSSALQTYLSRSPELSTPRSHRYVVIDGAGGVFDGEHIRARASSRPLQYLASTPHLWKLEGLEEIGKRLGALGKHSVLVLSQEGWSRRGRDCLEAQGLQRMGVRAQVVAYVRPQIEWFNSGWWQWWTWQEEFKTPADVLERWRNEFLCWRKQLDWWARNPNVSELTVRLYRRDTISDFLKVVGATAEAQASDLAMNSSLSPLHIKMLKFVPHLRGPHTSQVDSVLRKYLPSTEPSPWALRPEDMQRIVEGCHEDNKALMELLSPEDAEEMRHDPRWWSIEPYRERPVVTDDDLKVTLADLRFAVSALLRTLIDKE